MKEPTAEDRAWGFSQEEFTAAFARVLPLPHAQREVAAIFDQLRRDPTASIEGDDDLFGLLSLVSAEARQRVQAIRRWGIDEVHRHQERALGRSWLDDQAESSG